MAQHKFTVILSQSSMLSAMASADLEKCSIRHLCSRILADYFKDRQEILRDYALSKKRALSDSKTIFMDDIPKTMVEFLETVEPHYRDEDGFFMSNSELKMEMPKLTATRIGRFMRSIGHVQVMARVGNKVQRGYWMRKIKAEKPVYPEPTSFI